MTSPTYRATGPASTSAAGIRTGAGVWIGVGDVERLHEEHQARGVKIRPPPTNYPWALEMHVEDPDGNVLRLGSDPKDDRPFKT